MSAKEFYTPARPTVIHLDLLPDEILGEVLRQATYVPYVPDASDLVPKRLQSSNSAEIWKEYRCSLITRRYIVRVCKKWYHVGLPFMYEWILVSKAKNLKGIVNAVSERRFHDDPERGVVGHATKRLDIDFRWGGWETVEDGDEINSFLARLVRSLTELEVLVVGVCPWTPSPDWLFPRPEALHSQLSYQQTLPKLRYFNWLDREWVVFPDDLDFCDRWVPFVQSHRHLVGIHPPTFVGSLINHNTEGNCIHPDIHGFTHPALTTTRLHTEIDPFNVKIYTTLGLNAFPSLTRLIIDLSTNSTNTFGDVSLKEWITQPLVSLTVLQLNVHERRLDFDLDNILEIKPAHRLSTYMPNLQRIDLVLSSWPVTWSRFAPPQSVTQLGVRVCAKKPARRVVREFLRALKVIVGSRVGPELKIQFLDEGTQRMVLQHQEYLVRWSVREEILDQWLNDDGRKHSLFD